MGLPQDHMEVVQVQQEVPMVVMEPQVTMGSMGLDLLVHLEVTGDSLTEDPMLLQVRWSKAAEQHVYK